MSDGHRKVAPRVLDFEVTGKGGDRSGEVRVGDGAGVAAIDAVLAEEAGATATNAQTLSAMELAELLGEDGQDV